MTGGCHLNSRRRPWRCTRSMHPAGGPCALLPRWWNRTHYAAAVRAAARWPR